MFEFNKFGNKYRWEDYSTRIEYSNPRISSGGRYFTPLKDENDIFYYYYAIKIYRKDRDGIAHKIFENITHDFPCIIELKYILEHLLDMMPDENWQTIHFGDEDDTIEKRYMMKTGGFGNDDKCSVTKYIRENSEFYSFFFGFPQEDGFGTAWGILLDKLEREEIESLLNCVKAFINYSIEYENKMIALELKKERSNKVIENGKIYEFKTDKKLVDKTVIENIYVRGARLSSCHFLQNGECKDMPYNNTIIDNIKRDSVILRNNLSDELTEINIHDLLYISDDVAEELIKMDIDEIVDDFIGILSENEKDYFRNTPIDDIYHRYHEAIINRSWMCRTEHPFHKDDVYNVEMADNAVKEVIVKIVGKL